MKISAVVGIEELVANSRCRPLPLDLTEVTSFDAATTSPAQTSSNGTDNTISATTSSNGADNTISATTSSNGTDNTVYHHS